MPPQKVVRVEGLQELRRAFAVADKTLSRELVKGLRDAAEPVRSSAESLATSSIPRAGPTWSRMRVGVTRKSVYVAPRARGARGSRRRPNFADVLLGRAMQPALDANIGQVEREIENVLATVGRAWERA